MADQVLQEIKDRLDIIDVIGSYITLKKSGANYKATCPFHNEKSASFMVSPAKGIWHCFGCGEGGDIFGFVMRYENIEFRDVLQLLASRAGVELPQYKPDPSAPPDESEALIRINNFASRYYHQCLVAPSGKAPLQYLHDRGLNDGTIAAWNIGFAPDDFHKLEAALKQKGVTLDQMVKAGVSVKNDRGQMYDRFRNRITFPIKNYVGDVVGFTARVLDGSNEQAKYVNSPETTVYNKSKILFGLHAAKEAIRKADEVVVVEGQMDVIQAHQAGFINTIATSGTALTELHLGQLKNVRRLTQNIKFCFDADKAGLLATRRAGELALQMEFHPKIIVLTDVKDPDDLIRKSPGLWEKAVKEAVWFIDYYINKAVADFSEGSIEQIHYIKESIIPLLVCINDIIEQDHYIHRLSADFLISEKAIRDKIKELSSVSPENQSGTKSGMDEIQALPVDPAAKAQLTLEKQVLGGLLFSPEYLKFAQEQGLGEEIEDLELRRLANDAILGELDPQAVNREILAKEALFMVESQLDNLENNELALMRELEKSLFLLKLASVKRRQQELTLEIKKLEKQNDSAGVERLTHAFAELVQQRANVETQLSS